MKSPRTPEDQAILDAIGKNITKAREKAKDTKLRTVYSLAKASGVQRNKLARMEDGTNEAGIINLVKLGRTLGVHPGSFLPK